MKTPQPILIALKFIGLVIRALAIPFGLYLLYRFLSPSENLFLHFIGTVCFYLSSATFAFLAVAAVFGLVLSFKRRFK